MAIDARGVMLSYKYAAIQMIKQGRGGRIIGLCSNVLYQRLHLISYYLSSRSMFHRREKMYDFMIS